eukprot:GHVH01007353.1.p1 GENE.GHVH01007353.1~~GHVH01007353.1.p1  ORF type:complete len:493 (+),score=49.80 GHVH01007353.1:190-1668(+)
MFLNDLLLAHEMQPLLNMMDAFSLDPFEEEIAKYIEMTSQLPREGESKFGVNYFGSFRDGARRQGIGKLVVNVHDRKSTYEGMFSENAPNGIGRWIEHTSSHTLEAVRSYHGQLVHGKASGYGKYVYQLREGPCVEYLGTFYDDFRDGFGIQIMPHEGGGQVCYVGEFQCDKPHGFGMILVIPNTDGEEIERGAFLGFLHAGRCSEYGVVVHGHSVVARVDGSVADEAIDWKLVYEGGFTAGAEAAGIDSFTSTNALRNGLGRTLYLDGAMHWGNYVEGKMQGLGASLNRFGDVYSGGWSNGVQHGDGQVHWNGRTWVAKYVRGLRTHWHIATATGTDREFNLFHYLRKNRRKIRNGSIFIEVEGRNQFADTYISDIWDRAKMRSKMIKTTKDRANEESDGTTASSDDLVEEASRNVVIKKSVYDGLEEIPEMADSLLRYMTDFNIQSAMRQLISTDVGSNEFTEILNSIRNSEVRVNRATIEDRPDFWQFL